MGEEKTVHECYRYNEDTRERVDKLETRWEETTKNLYTAIENIKDNLMGRLPVWATLLMSFLTLLVGALLTLAFKGQPPAH